MFAGARGDRTIEFGPSAVSLPAMSVEVGVERYLCTACGNRTRFDVVESLRRLRFQHYTLGGEMSVEEETVLERSVESVTCRWCDRSDAVEVVQG